MLKSLWRPNLLSTFGASVKPTIGLRYTRTSLYEPVYLDVRTDSINIRIEKSRVNIN